MSIERLRWAAMISFVVALLGQVRIIPDTVIIVFGVLPLVYFLFRTFPHLEAQEIGEEVSAWERLGVDL